MRYVPPAMEAIWRNGDFTGENRPMARVTVQHPEMNLEAHELRSTFRRVDSPPGGTASFNPYPSGIDPTTGEPIMNTYADYLFSSVQEPRELPNIKSVSWTRSVDTDVAECTIEFWNTSPLPLGEKPQYGDLDQPGFFTAGRGKAAFSSRWKHVENEWSGALMPDNILRTYEGYGSDTALGEEIGGPNYVAPEDDTKLVLTGVWMIDEVKLSAVGTLVATCRDLGRLLLDHTSVVPVAPEDFYPVGFRDWSDKVTVLSQRNVITESNNVENLSARVIGSGNDKWPESAYSGAKVFGHTHTHAMDGDPGSFWLSVGNASSGYRSAYEYIDIQVDGGTVSQVAFWTLGSGYNAYVSVQVGGQWVGGPTMPYRRDGRGRYDEGIPYVAAVGGLGGEGEHTIHLGPIVGVNLIRLWLGNTQYLGIGAAAHKFRAAIREVAIRGPVYRRTETIVTDASERTLTPGPAGSNPGRCQDYTDIVKLMCAWAGLYWPARGYLLHSDGTSVPVRPKKGDSTVLGESVQGRVWGDFQQTGAAPPNEISASNFDKKTLMDGVAYVRDIVGFLFHVDETGAVQWRIPNVWTLGNWVGGDAPNPGRTSKMLVIDERQSLLALDATISSRAVREAVYVANGTGGYAAIVGGYNPNPTGLRRIGGWTDQNFASVNEARVMADLISVRQLFQYRKDAINIPAFPGLQIDDQVRVFERVTSEGFVHYVMGIASNLDMVTGSWTYDVQTHWLGDDPNGKWVFDKSELSPATIAYIDSLIVGSPEWVRADMDM